MQKLFSPFLEMVGSQPLRDKNGKTKSMIPYLYGKCHTIGIFSF